MGPLLVATSPTIKFVIQTLGIIFVGSGMRERCAATRLVAGPEPLSSGTERAREQGLMARVHSISENFLEKNSEISSGRGGLLGSHEHYNQETLANTMFAGPP